MEKKTGSWHASESPGERVEAVARIEERDRRLQRRRMGALLEDRGALAVVLADHDDGAADDAGRGDVRERVGRDVGADDRLPRDGAAHRIVDGGAEERGGRRLAAGLLEVDAERLEQRIVRVGQDVDQVRDRRARIAADVAHAGLEQRLGDRENAFAAKDLAFPVPELLDVLRERPLTHAATRDLPSYFCLAMI